MLAAVIVACCLPLYCEGDVSFENAIAEGKDGSIELDLSLNAIVSVMVKISLSSTDASMKKQAL